ncbi:MAG: hypothetical protein BGO98_02565 [Myxococcales bacterium 68-20]|nr:DUF2199 domain-containing protein [Myxococcales bacterium]OJY21727.1 MAG: hypothetical protein BGO98_02565 [Myxococcales bacterium 68-20]
MTECTECGRELAAHELDVGFSLPDEVWELAPSDRSRRADSTPDVCVLDGTRFFIRAVAVLPVEASQESFCWGLWVEVSGEEFERCRQSSDLDAPGKPSGRGIIANSPQSYPPLTGHPVAIEHRGAHERPWLHLEASDHPMSREQREGVSYSRVHELVRPFVPAPKGESDATWPFDQAPNVAAITTVQVLTQNAPILRVTPLFQRSLVGVPLRHDRRYERWSGHLDGQRRRVGSHGSGGRRPSTWMDGDACCARNAMGSRVGSGHVEQPLPPSLASSVPRPGGVDFGESTAPPRCILHSTGLVPEVTICVGTVRELRVVTPDGQRADRSEPLGSNGHIRIEMVAHMPRANGRDVSWCAYREPPDNGEDAD